MPLHTIALTKWAEALPSAEQENAIHALEHGKVIWLPNLLFPLEEDEKIFYNPECLQAGVKNISYNPLRDQLKGTSYSGVKADLLQQMMRRYALQSQTLINTLLPHYKAWLTYGRTSYRPAEISKRATSYRKDDTRLHVDAFPSAPNQGKRILRVFTNVNPYEKPRVWRLGEPFEMVAQQFIPRTTAPVWGASKFMEMLGITKTYRTAYDHYMLQIHDGMKKDLAYQSNAEQVEFHFPPASTWIVMTDQVSHAAMSGQYVFEQTFSLPVASMQCPDRSPLKVLEKLLGKALV